MRSQGGKSKLERERIEAENVGDDSYRPGHGWVGLRQGGERVWRLVPSALWDHSQVQGLLSFATRSDVAMATWLGSAKEQCRVRPPRGSRTAGAAADTRQTLTAPGTGPSPSHSLFHLRLQRPQGVGPSSGPALQLS